MDRRTFVAGLFGTAAVGGAAVAAGATGGPVTGQLTQNDFVLADGLPCVPKDESKSVDDLLREWYTDPYAGPELHDWLLRRAVEQAIREECDRLRPGYVWPTAADVREALLAAEGLATATRSPRLTFDVYDTRKAFGPAFPFSIGDEVRKATVALVEACPDGTRPFARVEIEDGLAHLSLSTLSLRR